jgi:fructosamine-3-kinase
VARSGAEGAGARVAGVLRRLLQADVVGVERLGGGDTALAFRVLIPPGSGPGELFVKLARRQAGQDPGMFVREAEGLDWLRDAGAIRVPEVVAADGEALVLEWIESSPASADHDERLGRGIAALHQAGADGFGAGTDNWIGPLPQANSPEPTWAEFYGRHRIEPLVRRAVDEGRLPVEASADTARLIDRLPELVGPREPPARLHGDLWGGNVLTGPGGGPVLIDPAAYAGHREVDLAMMRLFGGFRPRVFDAYAEAFPLAASHEDRVELYQLYPLLVHVVLFGGGYAGAALRALRRYR